MKVRSADIDGRVSEAFEDLVNWAKASSLLGEIAMRPNGRHEYTIANEFCGLLRKRKWNDAILRREYSQGNRRHDIVAKRNSRMDMVIEVKTPFTNHDGIRSKTRKNEHLPKDMDSLKTALDSGAANAYALITPIGCYPVDAREGMIVRDFGSLTKNEEAIKREFGIQWPTRRDYETTGKEEVENAMTVLAAERSLKVKRIKGWTKVKLPSPRPGICAFIDCALYKVRKKM